MTRNDVISIYYVYLNKALKAGISYHTFWNRVCFYTEPHDSDAASWAIASKEAYHSLCEDMRI